MQVKVCGIRDEAGARACADASVDLVGFNFVPSSKRCIDPTCARRLVRLVGPERAVGVFRNQDMSHVLRRAEQSSVRWIQLHGDETPLLCAALRARGYRVIKALAVGVAIARQDVAPFEAVTDLRLFDAPSPGSGRSFDHARLLALRPARPFLLAGGLRPDNVQQAIAAARPDGVDTASGVERDGQVDPARVAAFCDAARRARW